MFANREFLRSLKTTSPARPSAVAAIKGGATMQTNIGKGRELETVRSHYELCVRNFYGLSDDFGTKLTRRINREYATIAPWGNAGAT